MKYVCAKVTITNAVYTQNRSQIRLGEHDIKHPNPDCNTKCASMCNKGVQDFAVEKVTFHPDYNSPDKFRNDIAVIKLKEKVVENGT